MSRCWKNFFVWKYFLICFLIYKFIRFYDSIYFIEIIGSFVDVFYKIEFMKERDCMFIFGCLVFSRVFGIGEIINGC